MKAGELEERIIEHKNNFPSAISNLERRDFGVLFYNKRIPDSYDCNHALITDLDRDLGKAVEKIIDFYERRKLTPMLYQAFMDGEKEKLFPVLRKKGFEITEHDLKLLVHDEKSGFQGSDLEIKQVDEMNDDMEKMFSGTEDWVVKVMKEYLRNDNFYIFAGYHSGEPVCYGSLYSSSEMTTINDLFTQGEHRNKGFGKAVVDHLVSFHQENFGDPLLVWSKDWIAENIYERVGFVEVDLELPRWWARLEE